MLRDDGREDGELRGMDVVYERLDRVDGSSRFGFGECAIPIERDT